jgi:hypothetical protein
MDSSPQRPQYQGPDRRHSKAPYNGPDRRRLDWPFSGPPSDSTSITGTPDRKEEKPA